MNFYKNIYNYWFYNHICLFFYIVTYVYFIKGFDILLLPYLPSNNIDYSIIHKFLLDNILLSLSGKQYQSEYILFIILEKYIRKTMYK